MDEEAALLGKREKRVFHVGFNFCLSTEDIFNDDANNVLNVQKYLNVVLVSLC